MAIRWQKRRDIFELLKKLVDETAAETGRLQPQAFVKWFVDLYFPRSSDFFASDGSHDGKVDAFFKVTHGSDRVVRHVINSKFTSTFDQGAPGRYYDEAARFVPYPQRIGPGGSILPASRANSDRTTGRSSRPMTKDERTCSSSRVTSWIKPRLAGSASWGWR